MEQIVDKTSRLERQLAKLCQQIYEQGGRRIQPLFPWVLVRVLPKEQEVRGIILTDKQEVVTYEGIVLATWKPCTRTTNKVTRELTSAFKPGQRIVFHHMEGMRATDLDEKYYRFVREVVDQVTYPGMGVYGLIDYSGDKDTAVKLSELLSKYQMATMSGAGTTARD